MLAADVLFQLTDQVGLLGDGFLDQVANGQQADQLALG